MGKKFDLQLINGNTEQVFKNMVSQLNNSGKNMGQHKWMWMMNYLKWYTNHFIFENNEELEHIKDAIIEKLFWNGYAAISKIGDKPFVMNVSDIKYNMNKEIISAKRMNIMEKDMEDSVNLPKILTRENAVFCKSNFYSFPLFMGLEIFTEGIIEMWDLMKDELKNAITKYTVHIKNNETKMKDTIYKEIEMMMQRKGSLWQIIQANGIEIIPMTGETITETLQGYFKFVINYGYQMTGRLYNASEKLERNVVKEVSVNELQFQVIRNDLLSNIEKFAKHYDKLYGTNTKVRTLQEIEEERQALNTAISGNQILGEESEDKEDDIQ